MRNNILSTLPEGTEPLFISIGGSRSDEEIRKLGNGVNIKMIVKYPMNENV